MIRFRIAAIVTGLSLSSVAIAQWDAISWALYQGRDPITDLPTASARTTANTGTAKLSLVCSGAVSPVVSVQYQPGSFLGSSANIVIIRFDQEAPIVSSNWEYTNKGAFNREISEVMLLASKFSQDHKVFVRAMNYENQPIEATFTSHRGKDAINAVLSACKYPIVQ